MYINNILCFIHLMTWYYMYLQGNRDIHADRLEVNRYFANGGFEFVVIVDHVPVQAAQNTQITIRQPFQIFEVIF